ncbi:hypothetical protein PISMIDRAFT_12206 [Pisolithus microcarpus 441]|uniref:Uncharacterized protein n=1 Tax=Pisolithus microcarpus 441 TaxID=765257 RepID=A0A0C9YXV0_9AGAM|nr:hypothetical protein PISMIDRAFT_12206 [Pisolithus microcarpus 441]
MAGGAVRGHSHKCRSLTSSRIRHVQTHVHQVTGVARTLHELAGPRKIAEQSACAAERKQERLREMTVTERRALEVLRDPASNYVDNEPVGDDYENEGYGEMILDGTEPLDVSHAGGEFQELTRGLLGDFWKSTSEKVKGKCDYRTFRDRSTKQTAAFSVQLDAMAEAYMAWSLKQRGARDRGCFDSDEQRTWEEQQRKCNGVDTKLLSVLVLDVFCAEKTSITVGPTDRYLTSALVRHGLIPCSPIVPKVAITVQALDLYRTARQCCPHFSIQAYDEPAMRFRMLFAQDGNDSLKRVVTRMLDGDIDDAATSLPTSEHTFHHEQYLSHEFVDKFASNRQTGHSLVDEDGDGNLCAECWKNMKDSAMEKMWNVFNESGVFIASGEQSKYALAVTSKLLDAFGPDLGGRYDIGCRFKTTLASSAIGEHARSLNYTSLINAFHGHAHNRLCQLDNLTTYVEGLGLEDLEGCERAFSKSNALASSTRYASIFHRRQAIAYYFEHSDEMEVYANLIWLDEERLYLKSLLCEPPEESLQMEYWQRLVNLAASRQALETILSTWTVVTAQTAAPIWSDSSVTRKRETMRRHAQENYKKDLKAVQELEGRLGITRHWVPGDEEWQAASRLVTNRKYQRALDNVEQLVVLQIFELSKMNQSGTGYKLLIEYAFLANFDLLRDTRQDISTQPWASPTARLAINTYFKLCRAKEEVVHLNVKIHRVVMYLDTNPMLAYQISRYRTIRSRFTLLHLCSLEKISQLPGFSGMLAPGISMSRGPGDSASVPQRVHMETILSSLPVCANDGEEDIDEDADEDHATALEEQCEALQDILSVTMDA